MNICTFKTEAYKGCPVYYRTFGYHFEYLTIINGELYTAHCTILPTRINKVLYWLGIEPSYYSTQQFQKIIPQLRRLAQTTIDFILNPPKDQ